MNSSTTSTRGGHRAGPPEARGSIPGVQVASRTPSGAASVNNHRSSVCAHARKQRSNRSSRSRPAQRPPSLLSSSALSQKQMARAVALVFIVSAAALQAPRHRAARSVSRAAATLEEPVATKADLLPRERYVVELGRGQAGRVDAAATTPSWPQRRWEDSRPLSRPRPSFLSPGTQQCCFPHTDCEQPLQDARRQGRGEIRGALGEPQEPPRDVGRRAARARVITRAYSSRG